MYVIKYDINSLDIKMCTIGAIKTQIHVLLGRLFERIMKYD